MVYEANSKEVTSPQAGLHSKLIEVVERHRQSHSRRPVADHSLRAFETMMTWVGDDSIPLIMDSCCGVGQSTAMIAERFPDAKVIGIDKSGVRLERHHAYANQQDNYLLLRADLFDIWKLMLEAGIQLERHFLLYPTPWPKPGHLQRRWYASNAFPYLVALGGQFCVRSNWEMYLRECAQALRCYQITAQVSEFHSEQPLTPFEQKYQSSGQQLWQLDADLSAAINLIMTR